MNEPDLYLITVVHNRKAVTEAFVECVRTQVSCRVQLIVVDDGSTDGTEAAVKALLPSAVVLRGNGSLWWAGGLQKALNWLSARNPPPWQAVAFSNDDVSFGPSHCCQAVSELNRLPERAFLVVPGVFHPSGRQSDEAGIARWHRYAYGPYGHRVNQIDHATTRTLFMRWSDLRHVGGFHPSTLPHYTSDYEFTIRAHRRGIALVPAKTVSVRFFDETTGSHRTGGLTLSGRFRLLFSTRFSFNPIHHFVFVWYAVPIFWKVPSWARIFWSSLKFLL